MNKSLRELKDGSQTALSSIFSLSPGVIIRDEKPFGSKPVKLFVLPLTEQNAGVVALRPFFSFTFSELCTSPSSFPPLSPGRKFITKYRDF